MTVFGAARIVRVARGELSVVSSARLYPNWMPILTPGQVLSREIRTGVRMQDFAHGAYRIEKGKIRRGSTAIAIIRARTKTRERPILRRKGKL
jgi:hypothetical protein